MDWYSTFGTRITERIVREDFAHNVRSVMPLETIAAMTILAERYGWSDSQTVNECRIDMRLRHALCIPDADEVPSLEEILNGFRAMVDGHRRNSGINFISQLKERVTTEKGPVHWLDSGRLMKWAMRVA